VSATHVVGRPVVSSTALRSINFFNGRLLTGDDLRREQATERARLERLGTAVGEGVAYGLEVEEALATSTRSRPVVTVSPGLALSRSGLALELPAEIDVSLYQPVPPSNAEPGALFAECQPFAPGTYTAGAGVYLLTIGPDPQQEGRAPVSGLGNEEARCNVALSVEAVTFRLIRLALAPSQLADKAHLRNRIAYQCFDPEALGGAVANPFGKPVSTYGLVDVLRRQTLTDHEVPLAVIAWSVDDGIQFVDLWAVRRRLTRRGAEGEWAAFVGDRRRAETEAMVLQFQAQLEELRLDVAPETVAAKAHFELLPPLGFLPIGEAPDAAFDFAQFFADLPIRAPAVLEAARVEELVQDALAYPPIELETGELVWLYLIRQNLQAVTEAGSTPRRYVLFTNGQVSYRADARFELSYWNFANYAEVD
jgi:hypothetical protein